MTYNVISGTLNPTRSINQSTWSDTVTEDLQNIGMIWTDYEEIADDWAV